VLNSAKRAQEPGGAIGFCVSAHLSEDLHKALKAVLNFNGKPLAKMPTARNANGPK
jgi:hypothetical protein